MTISYDPTIHRSIVDGQPLKTRPFSNLKRRVIWVPGICFTNLPTFTSNPNFLHQTPQKSRGFFGGGESPKDFAAKYREILMEYTSKVGLGKKNVFFRGNLRVPPTPPRNKALLRETNGKNRPVIRP